MWRSTAARAAAESPAATAASSGAWPSLDARSAVSGPGTMARISPSSAWIAVSAVTRRLLLDGSTPIPERERVVDRFQLDDGTPRVLVLSLRAGGLGLNLTRANHVFHFDRWWNPAVEDQASDRAHRIGQTRVVQVHRMICAGTIEERIDQLIDAKRGLAEQIVDRGVESALSELSDQELSELVALRTEA